MFSHRRVSILFAVVYACLLLFLAGWVLHFKFDGSPSYGRCAYKFLENGFFDNAYRPPLYPTFLAFHISVFGEGWERWAIFSQIFLGAITCGMTVYLASRTGGHWLVGIVAVFSLCAGPMTLEDAMAGAEPLLGAAAEQVARLFVAARNDPT